MTAKRIVLSESVFFATVLCYTFRVIKMEQEVLRTLRGDVPKKEYNFIELELQESFAKMGIAPAHSERLVDQLNKLTLVTEHKEGRDLCERRKVTPSNGKAPPVMPPGKAGESQVEVKSNVFPMKLNVKGKAFQYAIVLIGEYQDRTGKTKTYAFNEMPHTDFDRIRNKETAFRIFRYMVEKRPKIFPPLAQCAFDGETSLYTAFQPIVMSHATLTVSIEREEDKANFPVREPFISIDMVIRDMDMPVDLDVYTDRGEITDVIRIESCLDAVVGMAIEEDRENHVCFQNNASYLMDPLKHGFHPNDMQDLGHCTYSGIGCTKNVRLLRSTQGPLPALVIEPKATPFHSTVSVAEKVITAYPEVRTKLNGLFPQITDAIKGLVVTPIHLENKIPGREPRPLRVKGVDVRNAFDATFYLDDNTETSVYDYYKDKYKIELQYPKLPMMLIYEHDKTRTSYHPMELYRVCDNQRVKGAQSVPMMVATLIKVAAALPQKVEQHVYKHATTLHLLENKYLHGFGAEVGTTPIVARGRVLQAPGFMYRGGQISSFDKIRGSWQSGHFVCPARITMWGCYAAEQSFKSKFNQESLRTFAKAFYDMCVSKGMQINGPAEIRCLENGSQFQNIKNVFESASSGGGDFLLFVTTPGDKIVHKIMKSMERKWGIVSQNVLDKTAASACGLMGPPKRLTLENLVNKANVKMGGLNYHVADMQAKTLLGTDDLFIGFAKDLGAGNIKEDERDDEGTGPTIIGFAANDIKEPLAFVGDYLFQDPRKNERVYFVVKTVERIVKRYIENRGKKPKRVFIYRNGLAESHFQLVLTYEIPVMKALLAKYEAGDLVYIVPNKMHNIRLYPARIQGTKPPEQNLKPGTVVDTTLVASKLNEFYCCAHVARLGTAKVPRYSVLSNEGNYSMDELQKITYMLSYGHQIITGATGLPSPVFIARRYAERGRKILSIIMHDAETRKAEMDADKPVRDAIIEKQLKKYQEEQLGMQSDEGQQEKKNGHSNTSSESGFNPLGQYAFYNRRFTYYGTKLRNQRYNA
uniref:Piwi domain-containing protein n=1 Tax=Bursaphelenchus xylophilus TaxID=6326 RepID=A0A1I7SBI2_BURXY